MRAPICLFALIVLSAEPAWAQTPETAVSETLDRLHQAASQADGAAYFDLFTPDARFIGTDVSERWSLQDFRAYAEPYFARGQGWTYVPVQRRIDIAPIDCACIAWFDEVLDSHSYGTTRGSGILRLTDDGWRVEQYVLSFPNPNAIARDLTDRIKAHEAAGDPAD